MLYEPENIKWLEDNGFSQLPTSVYVPNYWDGKIQVWGEVFSNECYINIGNSTFTCTDMNTFKSTILQLKETE